MSSIHNRTDPLMNLQRLWLHTRPAQVQNRQNPSAEKKRAQRRTHSQKGIHCHYLLGRKDLFFSNGVSHSEDRPYAQIVIDQNKRDPIFSKGWLFLLHFVCVFLSYFVFICFWLLIADFFFFEREKYQLKGKWEIRRNWLELGERKIKCSKYIIWKKKVERKQKSWGLERYH